jgi:sugar lactone lactonase YvrE
MLGAVLAATVTAAAFHVGGFHDPRAVAVDAHGNVFVAETGACRVVELPTGAAHPHPRTVAGGRCGHSPVGFAQAVAIGPNGVLYIADTSGNRVLLLRRGHVSTVPLRGLSGPTGLAVDAAGDVFVSDTGNCRVLELSAGTHTASTVAGTGVCGDAGDGGPAAAAELRLPGALAVTGSGTLYIADRGNDVVRQVSGGRISTVAGMGTYGFWLANGLSATGPLAVLNDIEGLAVDAHGDLFISDAASHAVRVVPAGTAVLNTVRLPAGLRYPAGLSATGAGGLVVADPGSGSVTALRTSANIATSSGS